MSNTPVAAHEDIPVSEPVIPLKNGPVILPKTRLSLWAAVLTLSGALALLGYRLFDSIALGSYLNYFKAPRNALELLEALSLMVTAILLFTARASGNSFKIPMLIWSAGALFGLPVAVNAFLMMLPPYHLLMAHYYLLMGVIPLLAALIAILYAFKVLKKTPALIIIGILLGAVFIAGTYQNLNALLGYTNYAISPFDAMYIRFGFILLYDLLFPTGIFLAVLASKKKDA